MKATCPHCQTVIDSDDLSKVMGHVATCTRKVKKAKVPRVRPERPAPIDLTGLPISFWIEKQLDSQNQHHKKHWTSYDRSKTEWRTIIAANLLILKDQQFEWSKWELVRFYKKPSRPFDYANLVGGCKPVPDALITAHIIVDDRPNNFECLYNQIESDEPGTLLRLLEARYSDD